MASDLAEKLTELDPSRSDIVEQLLDNGTKWAMVTISCHAKAKLENITPLLSLL
jgi:hypothetical protein